MENTISVIRGTSNTINILVTDVDGEWYGLEPGEEVIFGVKAKPEDEDYLIKKVINAGSGGVYTVKIEPNDTIGIPYGRYVYDVGLESSDDYYNIIPTSPFVVMPNVTKWGDGS